MTYENLSFNVRVWNIETLEGKKGSTYRLRWKVAQARFSRVMTTKGLADSFRSKLNAAANSGEAFRIDDGLPVSMGRVADEMNFYEFLCDYMDMKWPKAAATYRRTIAEALTAVMPVMLQDSGNRPDSVAIRSALTGWSFNVQRRNSENKPEEVEAVLRWIEQNALSVSAVMKPEVARALHDAAVSKLNGKPLARSVARQRRMILNNALDWAVAEKKVIPENLVKKVKWTAPKPSRAIDRRRVANPVQARTLLLAVKNRTRMGPRLYACYATMYFAAPRPEEAINLRKEHLKLPRPQVDGETGKLKYDWGKIYVERATPHAGKEWTDSGKARDDRGLKHREEGEGRFLPCPPELTEILLWHLDTYGTDADGRLFRGESGEGEVPLITWQRVWTAARKATFTEEVAATPLARRPYDLRHAAVSTWLNGGVPPTTVAEWAGHSLEVLLQVYATCLDGQDQLVQQQVERALGRSPERRER